MSFTPADIQQLEKNQVFVFGSNANGNHIGGAALLAKLKFGAIEGQARGLQGQSYGFETLNTKMKKHPLKEIKKQFKELFEFASSNTDKVFLVTKVGCGIAGFEENEIISCFDINEVPTNVWMPVKWKPVKGYKAFDSQFNCRYMKYEVGKTYEMNEYPVLCEKGFHFCIKGADVYQYYNYKNSIVCEVEALGEIETDGQKSVTNKIRILRQLTSDEASFNTGSENSGYGNSGYRNSGDMNSGYMNSGDRNSGYMNSGYRNSGNWNKGHYHTGFLNTGEAPIYLFNKIYKGKRENLEFPNFFCFDTTEWIYASDMTEQEKIQHPKWEINDGYLKMIPMEEAWRKAWDNASDDDRRKH